jgi:hypothetical protein
LKKENLKAGKDLAKKVTLYLAKNDYHTLQARAKEEGLTVSALLRWHVRFALDLDRSIGPLKRNIEAQAKALEVVANKIRNDHDLVFLALREARHGVEISSLLARRMIEKSQGQEQWEKTRQEVFLSAQKWATRAKEQYGKRDERQEGKG